MSAIVTPPAPAAPNTPPPVGGPRPLRYTVEQYEKLGKAGFFTERRYQLIRGEIIDMGDQGPRHFTYVDLAVEVLKAAFGPSFYVRNAGPISLTDSKPEPDVSVVPGKRFDYATKHPGTALLAVEVSDTTLNYDLTTKAELYATAGIPEYWVLDLDGKQLHVFRDPAALPPALEATAYGTHLTYAPGDTVTPLHAANSVPVADLLP
jgi:Uma2 family endonuclease